MKLEYNDNSIALLRKLKSKGKFIDEDTLVIEKPSITIKILKKDEEIIGFDITESKEGLAYIKKLLTECEVITQKDINPWPELTLDALKTAQYSKIFYERKKFLETINSIKKLKCNKIVFDKKLDKDFIENDITILFNPVFENLEFYDTIKNKDVDYKFPKKDDGKDIDIITDKKIQGRYYKKRNCIILLINPFENDEIIDIYNGLSVKKENVEDFKLFNLNKEFTKNIDGKLRDNESQIKTDESDIKSYQSNIFDKFKRIRLNRDENDSLLHMRENFGKTFIEEIKKTKELKIVENVDYTLKEIIVTYKPTCITKANFMRSKGYGKRSFYIGNVKLRIGYNYVKVANDLKLCLYKTEGDPNSDVSESYPHPHAHDDGGCCLGQEATKDTIYSLQSQLKISELALYFWLFVKNYGEDGGYFKPQSMYNFCLMRGFPVFDGSGKQIYINDEKRIQDGEQIKLKKSKDYDENIKKFKDFKPW